MLLNWSKRDVERAIKKAQERGQDSVTLSMIYNSSDNEQEVVQWVEELGHKATLEMERTVVTLKKGVYSNG